MQAADESHEQKVLSSTAICQSVVCVCVCAHLLDPDTHWSAVYPGQRSCDTWTWSHDQMECHVPKSAKRQAMIAPDCN